MSVVKISNKESLEKLQAKLTLRLGRKLSQQETLDLCIKSGLDNTDTLIKYIEETPILNKQKIESIIISRSKLANTPYEIKNPNISDDDRDIYT